MEIEGSPAPEDQNFLPDVVFFHGKELRSGLGQRQSFIRKPGTEQVLVRIGIGRDGLYKVDGIENKISEQWPFSDLKDCSFSGYSCTLQFHSSNRNYSVRTDDGEAICSYIDNFQKQPEEALKRARENPPNSKIPESGVRTLRRKFSGQDAKPSASEQVKFYTMNRRSKKNTDPTSKLTHNVDVDSRLRDAYIQKISPEPVSAPIIPLIVKDNDTTITSSSSGDSNSKVNGISQQKEAELMHVTNGGSVLVAPHSTRGEITENQQTNHEEKSTNLSSSSSSQPATLNETVSAPPSESPPVSAAHTPTSQKETLPVTEDPNDYFLLRQRSVSETTVQRGNSRPINLVKTVTMPWGSSDKSGRGSMKDGGGRKSLTLGSAPRRGSHPVISGSVNSPQDKTIHGTIAEEKLSNSSLSQSSSSDLQSMPTSSSKLQHSEQNSSQGGGVAWYQSPGTPTDDGTNNRSRAFSPPYDTLSRSDSGMSSERMEFGGGIQSLKREDTSNSMDNFQINLPSPPPSPLYDHLPPSSPNENETIGTLPVPVSVPIDVPMRRNVSQPVMSRVGGGVGQNSTSPGPNSIAEEEEEEEEDSDEQTSEPTLDHGGVVFRQKKNVAHRNESDPFEDLLGTPQAVARLRWSQELNPLYDLIKSMKISESISSQEKGIKFYSTSAPDNGGKKMKKLPSVIFEESEVNTKQESTTVPVITHSVHDMDGEEGDGEGDEGDRIPMIIPENKSSGHLPRAPRRQHNYEEVAIPRLMEARTTSIAGLIQPPPIVKKTKETATGSSATLGPMGSGKIELLRGNKSSSTATLSTLTNPAVRRLQTLESPQERSGSVSPRLGKRELQRRSRTISCMDDTEAVARKQKPLRAADMMKDFSFVVREFRLFYIKLPNGQMHSEVFSINRPVSELCEKLCDLLGIENADHYVLYVEGACLTSLKEGEIGEGMVQGFGRSNSLTHIMDHQWLPDLGSEALLLKPALSFHMQGITTSRVLALRCDNVVVEVNNTYPYNVPQGDEEEEFHKHWISIVQGNIPSTAEQAVKLAAIQYQAYFIDRTAVHSVVGFCRPNEFLPTEFSGVRGLEQKMYKEQEKLKHMKTHKAVHVAYSKLMTQLPTFNTIFFPVREPRKKVLQSTKLKSVILGVGPHGIMRVDPKTKEVLDVWDYQVLRNWAFSRKTFVLAFTDKNYPVESNQAKWISMVVDFFVDSIIGIGGPPQTITTKS